MKATSLENSATISVALVNMPFAMADRPSIQCGLLKAGLTRAGYDVDVLYLNLEFAAEFGAAFYREISRLRTDLLLGEWLFSTAAFDLKDDQEDYRKACPSVDKTCDKLSIDFERLCKLRSELLPAWIDRWADQVDWSRYTVVGFTSTFEQNTASFSLARRIKERHSGVPILFGGANFDGTMGREYVRALSFIDYAVVGEGDKVLPQMIERLARGESPLGLPGVVGRRDGKLIENGPAPRVDDMNSVPDPDYDEYFATLFRLGTAKALGNAAPLLLIETSRGCWWGEKQHCTFCGLNNNGMKFRSKSPEEATLQLKRLSSKYKIVNFEAVDNIIDYKYLEQLCKPLSQKRYDYRIFYEVKANLSPGQIQTMARAGITGIQPGIESLNSHILALMRKGVTMLRNVRLLKWAYYYGMRVSWNILTGFPGETEEDYAEQIRVVSTLRHLPPPAGVGPIWLERFSPYFFDRSFPVKNVRPLDVYSFIYPAEINLDNIAYFFNYDMDSTLPRDFIPNSTNWLTIGASYGNAVRVRSFSISGLPAGSRSWTNAAKIPSYIRLKVGKPISTSCAVRLSGVKAPFTSTLPKTMGTVPSAEKKSAPLSTSSATWA
ncbi:MAG TPA: RiPP maturation radical SAM C-methyltransferase [Thermoanaerobaculia bacterium]|jgi:ribosomal peptide maturation radical SAM protein 1|nr:RiPP maturation radical SAM C-methyltransferase [Thermoanaerobaculia bacterium]